MTDRKNQHFAEYYTGPSVLAAVVNTVLRITVHFIAQT